MGRGEKTLLTTLQTDLEPLVIRKPLLKLGNYFSNKNLTLSLLTKDVYLSVFQCYDYYCP